MKRKTLVTLCIVEVGVFVLLAGGLAFVPTSRSGPLFSTVEAIEQNDERQIDRLLGLAQNRQLGYGTTFNDPTDVVLFNAPERP